MQSVTTSLAGIEFTFEGGQKGSMDWQDIEAIHVHLVDMMTQHAVILEVTHVSGNSLEIDDAADGFSKLLESLPGQLPMAVDPRSAVSGLHPEVPPVCLFKR